MSFMFISNSKNACTVRGCVSNLRFAPSPLALCPPAALSASLRVATVDSWFIRFWPTRIALDGKSLALAAGKP